MTTPAPEFIARAGGCLVSRNILEGRGGVKWVTREPSQNPVDNGWRVLADTDTDDFLADPDNIVVVDFNTVAAIEPALIAIYTLPVGTDLQLVVQSGRRTWYDNATGYALTLP